MCLCLMNDMHYFDKQYEKNSSSRNQAIVARQQYPSIMCLPTFLNSTLRLRIGLHAENISHSLFPRKML